MEGAYGGLIVIIIYGTAIEAHEEDLALITDNNIFILTDTSDKILV